MPTTTSSRRSSPRRRRRARSRSFSSSRRPGRAAKPTRSPNAEALAKQLESKTLTLPAKCGGNGKLFGAITNAQIAEAIASSFDISIDRHRIEFDGNIKALGTYPVQIRLGKSITANATVQVVAAAS